MAVIVSHLAKIFLQINQKNRQGFKHLAIFGGYQINFLSGNFRHAYKTFTVSDQSKICRN